MDNTIKTSELAELTSVPVKKEKKIKLVVSDIEGCLNLNEHTYDLEALNWIRVANQLAREDNPIPFITVCSGRQHAFVEAITQIISGTLHAVENLQSLPELASNHIRLLRAALRQLFSSHYQNALGMEEIDVCQCEVETSSGQRCSNTAYWRYNGIAICLRHIQSMVRKQEKESIF